jgi:hypothetical protein
MSDYMVARVQELREATVLMNDNLRVEELKRKQQTWEPRMRTHIHFILN